MRGARFRGARLNKAVLAKADLREAALGRADEHAPPGDRRRKTRHVKPTFGITLDLRLAFAVNDAARRRIVTRSAATAGGAAQQKITATSAPIGRDTMAEPSQG
jgi:hypothetical protein